MTSRSLLSGFPTGEATCPHCGNLVWIADPDTSVADDLRRLAELGADVETDDELEICVVRLSGHRYNDGCISKLAELTDVSVIDIRNTDISEEGAKRLSRLLPDTIVKY